MKKLYIVLAGILLLALAGCIKREPEPSDMDYYKNKIITLRIDNLDFEAGDDAYFIIGAVKVDPNSPGRIPISVNGKEVEGDLAFITDEMIEDGAVTIQTLAEAWELIVEYSLSANGTPYTLTLSPSFDGVSADPIIFNMKNTRPLSGTLEIKEYKR